MTLQLFTYADSRPDLSNVFDFASLVFERVTKDLVERYLQTWKCQLGD